MEVVAVELEQGGVAAAPELQHTVQYSTVQYTVQSVTCSEDTRGSGVTGWLTGPSASW